MIKLSNKSGEVFTFWVNPKREQYYQNILDHHDSVNTVIARALTVALVGEYLWGNISLKDLARSTGYFIHLTGEDERLNRTLLDLAEFGREYLENPEVDNEYLQYLNEFIKELADFYRKNIQVLD